MKVWKNKGQAKIKWRPVVNKSNPNKGSCSPASTSKAVKAEGVRSWGGGIGNNVNNIANGVNSAERTAIAKLDKALRTHRHNRKKAPKVKVVEFQGVSQHFPSPYQKVEQPKRFVDVSQIKATTGTWDNFTASALSNLRRHFK